jgi:hypothetical protein
MTRIRNSSYEYSFADDLHLITETITHHFPLCDHLKAVADACIHNDVVLLDSAVIECQEHHRRLDLESFLRQYKVKVQSAAEIDVPR